MERRNQGRSKLKSIHSGVPRHRAREGGAQHRESSPPPAAATPKLVEFATPRTADSTLDADHDDDLVARYRRMEDLLGRGEPPGLVTRQLEQEVESGGHTARDTEP